MDKNRGKQIDYGNWMPKKYIYITTGIAVVFLGLSYLSLLYLIGVFIFLIPAVYFAYARYQFSPRGANLQVKIRDLIFDKLVWSGEGKLLDIGCGNGAMAIETARRYPEAQVTGIDYWGGAWEYSKDVCERNAGIAGVAERTCFKKASASKLPFPDGSFDVTVSNLVFHSVQDERDKKEVIREALRVLKKGGLFVFQDLFLVEEIFGKPQDLLAAIRSWGIDDIEFLNTRDQAFIPGPMKLPFMVGKIGIISGKK